MYVTRILLEYHSNTTRTHTLYSYHFTKWKTDMQKYWPTFTWMLLLIMESFSCVSIICVSCIKTVKEPFLLFWGINILFFFIFSPSNILSPSSHLRVSPWVTAALIAICKEYHQRIAQLEDIKYDLEYAVRQKEFVVWVNVDNHVSTIFFSIFMSKPLLFDWYSAEALTLLQVFFYFAIFCCAGGVFVMWLVFVYFWFFFVFRYINNNVCFSYS